MKEALVPHTVEEKKLVDEAALDTSEVKKALVLVTLVVETLVAVNAPCTFKPAVDVPPANCKAFVVFAPAFVIS